MTDNVLSGAENGIPGDMNAATAFSSSRCYAEGDVRVLFIGNSITLHEVNTSLGWMNRCGMAASAIEKDYVHLVVSGIEGETGRKADLLVRNLADFERDFESFDLAKIDDLVAFRPDFLVVALGENVRELSTDEDRIAFRSAFKKLLERFTYGRMKPNTVVRGSFWPNPVRDELMAHAASDLAMPFVAAPCLDDSMTAKGLFVHQGVAAHPGDKGMAMIAEKVLEGFFPKSAGFTAWVDGKPEPVVPIRVSRLPFNQWAAGYQRPVDQTELAGMLRFEIDGAAEIRVRPDKPFKTAKVRPLSACVKCGIVEDEVRFTLPKPGYYVLEIDGRHNPLEIFADPRRDFAEERKGANIVFGPGRHEPVIVKLKSHDRVFIDRDAIVYGSFQADGVEDVRVSGYGMICGSRNRRVGDNCYREGMDGAIRVIDSRNVVFDGPVVLDSCCWMVSAFNSCDIEFANLKITCAWRYNTDGIDICNSQHVRVHDCYVHSFDDGLVVKGNPTFEGAESATPYDPVEDVRFERCICWCDWGRTLEIGLETWAPRYRDVSYIDCDLIHNDAAALGVSIGGPDNVEDITFRDIRIEYDSEQVAGVIQTSRDQKMESFKPDAGFWFCAFNGRWFMNKERLGTCDRVVVENIDITVEDGAMMPGFFATPEKGTEFGRIDFRNIRVNGREYTVPR